MPPKNPILRLAYAIEFLIAIIAVFVLWSQVGGQSHLDPLPWFVKLALGGAAAFAVVKATAEAVSQEAAWHRGTLKWCGILLALLVGCGMASLYSHNYLESDEPPDEETITSWEPQNRSRVPEKRDLASTRAMGRVR